LRVRVPPVTPVPALRIRLSSSDKEIVET